MGAFYGSVHVRTGDRAIVLAAAKTLARKDTRLLVGPALRGWVGVYPSGNGQDDRVARLLAKRLADELIHVMVHDDDIFAYSYYRDGKLVDRYNSQPDYFGKVPDREKGKVRGQPEKLAPLLADPSRLDALRDLLLPERARASVFAGDMLLQFAELLGLSNVVTAYEYLMEEEDDRIERWDEFIHLPDLSNERVAKAAEEARQARVRQQWLHEGVLRLEERRPTNGFARNIPYFCPDAADGFLVCWADGLCPEPIPLEHYRPPWEVPAPATGIEIHPIRCLCLSPSGRYLATGGLNARLWDFANRELVLEVAHTRGVDWVGFSPDEQLLISLGSHDCYVTSIKTGQRVSAPAVQHANHGAIHPGGTLIVTDQTSRLHLVDVRSGAVQKSLRIGGKHELQSSAQAVLAVMKLGLSEFDPAEFERTLKTELDQVDHRVKMMVDRLAAAGAICSERQAEEFRAQFLKSIENSRAFVEKQRQQVESGHIEVNVERTSGLTLSRDGRWLCLATDLGVRVYAWDATTAATDYLPDPVFRFDSASTRTNDQHFVGGHIYSMAVHESGHQLVFGGIAGRIDFLDLTTGRHSVLCNLPGNPAVLRLCLSTDEAHLACCVLPNIFDQSRNAKPAELHIWDVAALMRIAR